jgi:hypothetical protein
VATPVQGNRLLRVLKRHPNKGAKTSEVSSSFFTHPVASPARLSGFENKIVEPGTVSTYLCPRKIFCYIMKSLLKFSLLTALIISGKMAKQAAPATVAQTANTQSAPSSSVVLVHQVYGNEPVQTGRQKAQPQQSGSGFLAKMF